MSKFQQIRLHNSDGSITIKGELVLETPAHWQVAVNGTVHAYSKAEYRDTTPLPGFDAAQDVFGNLFGGHR